MPEQVIHSNEDAVEHLTGPINAIVGRYHAAAQDDVRQACWVAVFHTLAQKGATNKFVLLRACRYAAYRELHRESTRGMTPHRSNRAPPSVSTLKFDPSVESTEGPLIRVSTKQQDQVVEAMKHLITQGLRVSDSEISRLTGIRRQQIKHIIQQIRDLNNGNNQTTQT